jgi:hypothetical protein
MSVGSKVLLPIGANIPREWCVKLTEERMEIVVPSRSKQGQNYLVELDNHTRLLSCDCNGFKYRGYCHHTAGLIWMTYKKSRKKGVQDTSLAAYYSFTEDDLGERQLAVYNELSKCPGSNKELAMRMHWPINTITPRCKELRDMGAVIEFGKQLDPKTNRQEMVWMAIPGLITKGG